MSAMSMNILILFMCIGSRLGIFNRSSCDADGCGSMTSGLVGEMSFKVLPNISPLFTMVLTGFAMLVSVGSS